MWRSATICLLCCSVGYAVVLDRIAVVVGKQVIKQSELVRDLRVTAFLNREPLDLSSSAKRRAAERLVDQANIRREIANGGYQRPADSEALSLYGGIRQDRFGGSDTTMLAALSKYGLTRQELIQALLWQLTVLRFIDERFRTGVLVTDEDIESYYQQHSSELKKQSGETSLDKLAPKIRELLEGERVNQNFTAWLDEQRKETPAEFKPAAFE